ncbi:potassium channel family protein [Candidatus Poribacteria bacterium]|jgi:voltage-gated potassium channel|nr:potassium channel family protein [Candidatus Poribacteria bacterium]MBT5534538.1 potassium channel family protein [Candidatus Poribacteria bacterium]MBT5711611.1 potassium channel family protein [Candidatus Poribacteria bacterium]MBT7101400.1 potassium channel family protein [Candidatus Poribacteria bacterium]MBT7805694.1 potassium channel family protein [Candidatus Poribacteria bacterium]
MKDSATVRSWWAPFHNFMHEGFANTSSTLYQRVSNVVMWAIFVSIALIVLETVGDLATRWAVFFTVAESVVVTIFVVEYIANVYVTKPWRAHVLGTWGIIDLVAILPSLIGFLPMRQIRVVRVLRVLRFLRLLRVLKLARQVTDAYKESAAEREQGTMRLDLEIYFLTMFSVLIISSALMYYAESSVVGTQFTNIPVAMWWSVQTMTTVGYGDVLPVTLAGQGVAAITALCGLALFAMLTQVLGKAMIRGLFGGSEDELHEANMDAVGHEALSELEHIAELRDTDMISQEEFETQRDLLVSRV